MDIKVQGFRELASRLRSLAGPQKTEALKRSLRPVGKLTKKAIEDRAPVRPEQPTTTALPVGALKSDVHYAVTVDEHKGIGQVTTGPGRKTRHVANWVEYGHKLTKG
ncbi:MAG TPA: HK97 gp10 family phage protein, partial [Bryobacteraceae bacterium]